MTNDSPWHKDAVGGRPPHQTSWYRRHGTDLTVQTSRYRRHGTDVTVQTSRYRRHGTDVTVQTSRYTGSAFAAQSAEARPTRSLLFAAIVLLGAMRAPLGALLAGVAWCGLAHGGVHGVAAAGAESDVFIAMLAESTLVHAPAFAAGFAIAPASRRMISGARFAGALGLVSLLMAAAPCLMTAPPNTINKDPSIRIRQSGSVAQRILRHSDFRQ